MIKYIVTWVLTTYFNVPCPTIQPVPDEYGRVPQSTMVLAISCMESKTDTLIKEFTERKTAVAFIERGQKETFLLGLTAQLSNFKLDSVLVKK